MIRHLGSMEMATFSFLLCRSICPSTKTKEAKKLTQSFLLLPCHPLPPPPPPPLLPLPFHRRRRHPSQYAGSKWWWRGQEITCRFPCHLFPKARNSRGWKTYFKCICACGDKGEGSPRPEEWRRGTVHEIKLFLNGWIWYLDILFKKRFMYFLLLSLFFYQARIILRSIN